MLSATALAYGAAAEASVVRAGDSSARDWSQIYLAVNPSVSPDGSFIVFEWKDRVWRAPTVGGTAVPLGDGMSVERRPFISPDGRRVAYLSDRWGAEQLFESELGEDVFSVSRTRQITFHTESLMPWGYTADGASMVAIAYRDDASEGPSNKRISCRPILVPMGRRGAERRLFDAPAYAPAVSPDGSKVLFTSVIEQKGLEFRKRHEWSKTSLAGDIWMYDVATGAFTPVVRRRESAAYPVWTPDGKGFYYLCDAGGVRNVYHHALDGGAERQLTNFSDDHVFSPSLSRDGRTMVFAKGFDLWRIDPTAERPEPVRIALKPAGFDPSLPTVRRRSYTCCDNNYGNGNCTFRDKGKEAAFTAGGDVWVVALEDEGRQPVLVHGSSRTHERDCAFSPDGSTLYYLSDRGDGTDVWCARCAETNRPWAKNTVFKRKRLVSDDKCRRGLSVSPDGRLLAWHDMNGRLTFADTDGKVCAVAKVDSVLCDSYSWCPNGHYVAAALRDGYSNTDVWIIPTWEKDEDGKPAPEPCNISRNYKWDGTPAWSSDGRIVAFSGRRTATGDNQYIFYAYLDPADEDAETAVDGRIRKEDNKPDFATLPDRVRSTGVAGRSPIFSHDGRTLAFTFGTSVSTIKIPKRMKPEKILSKDGLPVSWRKDDAGGKMLRMVDRLPAHGDKTFSFYAYQETDMHDYQELAFLTAWANLRDGFCDPDMHGADWQAVRGKYRLAARYAPSWSVFSRVIKMMNGELDASHLGFRAGDVAASRWADPPWKRGWKIFTVHLGARFDAAYAGEGWRVRDVVPRSPADKGEKGLLPGDVVLSVDGRKVSPGMDYAEVMNGPLPHRYRLRVRREGVKGLLVREVEGTTFAAVRKLIRDADVEKARAYVRGRGNFGYLAIDAMNAASADAFTDQVFAECFGKDGVVVDVRYNGGGFTADRLIDILCGNRHARTLSRGMGNEGFPMERYARPVITTLPAVVLANQRSQSNAEEFSHAMQVLGRAKVVGMETSGDVIGTTDVNILDYGIARRPRTGFFLRDGRDMEGHGAKPDIEVDLTPADIAAGRDPQLDAALRALAEEVASRVPPAPLRFAPRQ